ncbi:Fusaric acid resistance protein-like [Dyella jiangningensis]|uniref:FUSC family protein n=1 Tax=Dyella sp. AtDHG13 TaxID=1938897 RepID=UPI00087F94ED|nr:FUSC family protein [Dyella sp. AtDHG13]PXV59178.1 fusaric acid resistance family protein [Dyella sp. AtDHG13]SDK24976.1 Fusaric acid resistance protein-like [Dyella jiangningensis]
MSDQPSLRDNIRQLFDVQQGLAFVYRHLPWTHRLMQGAWFALLALLAASASYGLGMLLHTQQAFWAALTAIAVTQQTYLDTRSSSRDQIIGALVGSVAGFGAVLLLGEQYLAYVVGLVAAIGACWLFGVGSAARLSASTTTIIMLVPHTGSFWLIALTRVGEVALGIGCALAVVAVAERVQHWWMGPGDTSDMASDS